MADVRTTEILNSAVEHGTVSQVVDEYLKQFGESVVSAREAAEMNSNFYTLVTDFYLHAWGRLFHFGALNKGEALHDALIRHEYYLADQLALHEGERCLDIGCGVAGPMLNIARKTGAQITGINNCAYQIKKARQFIVRQKMEHSCAVLECDWMQIPLESETYDKAYAIEATCHAALRRTELFKEINRLLKPGALFAGYEWVMTEKYNPQDALHRSVKRDIEIGNGISKLTSADAVHDALTAAGFEVLEITDRARSCDPETPWYAPLQGNGFALSMIRKSPAGRLIMRNIFRSLEKIGVLPKGTLQVSKLLNIAGEALVKSGELDIFTPMLLFVARKKG